MAWHVTSSVLWELTALGPLSICVCLSHSCSRNSRNLGYTYSMSITVAHCNRNSLQTHRRSSKNIIRKFLPCVVSVTMRACIYCQTTTTTILRIMEIEYKSANIGLYMFFVRQQSNQCGLHAIQNLFKSASVTRDDLHRACASIHKETGDAVSNHESFGGDWSVEALCQALHNRGYNVERAVETKNERTWRAPDMDTLAQDPLFRGFLIHQPTNHHFTCIRPETVDGDNLLYYVDSQSAGPIRISSRLAMRRCLAAAYAWEPFVVRGPEMDYVEPTASPVSVYQGVAREDDNRVKFKPSAEFLREWANLSESKTAAQAAPTSTSSRPAMLESVPGDR